MRRVVASVVLLALMYASSAGVASSLAVSNAAGSRAGVTTAETADASLGPDLETIMKANNWSQAEAQAYQTKNDAIGTVANGVAAARPTAFVGSALGELPGDPPTLYVKGSADTVIDDLVGAAPIPVTVVEDQPFSFDELEARQLSVHNALLSAGFEDVVTRINITGKGRVPVSLTTKPGLPDSPDAILALVPADLRSSVDLTLRNEPIVKPAGAFGGMRLQDDGVGECTSGWTVQQLGSGTRGISGAGHCFGINQVNHAGVIHPAVWQNEHVGQWGDLEWYTTNQAEADDFYADAANIRDVQAVEPRANIAVNEFVCVYGRSSNQRNCNMQVRDVSIACGNLNRLVQMDEGFVIGGDSGGGWSFNFTAYGETFGSCDALDSWTVADLFDNALGIFVPVV